MKELQDYITQLEERVNTQQATINTQNNKLQKMEEESREGIGQGRTVDMMQEQLRLHEAERKRWERQLQLKDRQHRDERDIMHEQIETLQLRIEQLSI